MYWPIWLVSARLFALTLLELLRIIGHREAVEAGRIWLDAEAKELGNHARNASWTSIPRSEVPSDRRIHKLIWVYKLKRDGSAKARLCVQGNTLQSGVDFDQNGPPPFAIPPRARSSPTPRERGAECAA